MIKNLENRMEKMQESINKDLEELKNKHTETKDTITEIKNTLEEIPCSSVGKESVFSTGDPGSIPGLGRSLVEGNSNPLQYSCLENSMDRGAWQATVHGITRVRHDLALSFSFLLLEPL